MHIDYAPVMNNCASSKLANYVLSTEPIWIAPQVRGHLLVHAKLRFKCLSNAISEKTKAIMVVNLLGNSNDFDEINRIIGDRDILIIEDNESMGATFNNRFTGTFGLMGTFSCFFSHHISTMEGGVVLTDDEELYHIMLALRAHGWTRNLPKINTLTGEKSDDPFEESFKFVLPGYNLRLNVGCLGN